MKHEPASFTWAVRQNSRDSFPSAIFNLAVRCRRYPLRCRSACLCTPCRCQHRLQWPRQMLCHLLRLLCQAPDGLMSGQSQRRKGLVIAKGLAAEVGLPPDRFAEVTFLTRTSLSLSSTCKRIHVCLSLHSFNLQTTAPGTETCGQDSRHFLVPRTDRRSPSHNDPISTLQSFLKSTTRPAIITQIRHAKRWDGTK